MAIYCMQCGKELPDDANFCLKCGKPVRNASAAPATASPKVEYKSVLLDLSKQPYIQYATPYGSRPDIPESDAEKHRAEMGAHQRIMEALNPYFNEGWELDGSFSSSVNMSWVAKGGFNIKARLVEATVRLRRYK